MNTSKDLHYMLLCSELEGNDSFNMECWKDHKYYFDTEDEVPTFVNGTPNTVNINVVNDTKN